MPTAIGSRPPQPMLKHPERFHALDATRAFALLLGVVFHAAWFYTLDPLNAGVKDVSANHFFGWFFHTSHTFRMQVFFLIAGFFARLVCERRGTSTFVRNRLVRIGVPLVVGWLILYPLLAMVWVWGKNLSGENPFELPAHLVPIGLVATGSMFVERADGGAFSLAHLWFLYYLLVLYAVTLIGRAALLRTPLGGERALAACDRATGFLCRSPLGALVLIIAITPIMCSMTSWSGIDTPVNSQTPILKVAVAYLIFFLLGWFVHRQAHQLGAFFTQWKFYLTAGLLASLGLYVFYQDVKPYSSESNQVLADPDFLTPAFRPKVSFEEPRRFDRTVIRPHREVLQPSWSGLPFREYRAESWYQPTKLAFSALYSFIMIWLVYGCLGAFQALCQGFSPIWRYITDSSYWVYLLHLPLLPAIETLVFDWEAPSLIKFPLVLGASFFLLFASYHYLVRSSFIGKILNGRAYPLHWNPVKAIRGIPDSSMPGSMKRLKGCAAPVTAGANPQ